MAKKQDGLDLFEEFKAGILDIDPAAFCERNLSIDGKPFELNGNGYKPLADVYRYIGLKAVEPNARPVVLVKGRQIGATVMCAALECYFMACGLYGNNGRPPMRIMHLFPTLSLAAAYTKTKLNTMMSSARPVPGELKPNGMLKTIIETKLDNTDPSGNNLHFKRFIGDNQIMVESSGLDGDRVRGRSMDALFADECFPAGQYIETDCGKQSIYSLYYQWKHNKSLPLIKTYNEKNDEFEYKKMVRAWKRDKQSLIKIICENRKIKCTPNHKFLTINGWVAAQDLCVGDLIKTTPANTNQISYSLNDDQFQIILGSFLGDGHISNHGLNKYRLCEIHGIKQGDYCSWKASIFNTKTKYVKNNGYSQKPARVFRSKIFCLNRSFPQKKDRCPQWVLDSLDERGLAVWFMDDGSVFKNFCGARLHTCSFDEDSQKRIVQRLKSMGVDCKYHFYTKKNRNVSGYYTIYISKKGYDKLCNIIKPYIHSDLYYKVFGASDEVSNYEWNNKFHNHGLISVKDIKQVKKQEFVYDIEVEDNHNFIAASGRKSKGNGGLIVHNCQDTPPIALGAVTKILSQSQYGPVGEGVQVLFGTPKQKGTNYYNTWQASTQQYFHLGCENCGEYFPLYRPDVNWEEIWLYGFVVKCTECGHEQDKLEAQERGKWFVLGDKDAPFVGYHLNQLYIPRFAKETIIKQKPEHNPNNTERIYQNEVLGEFYDGEGTTISPEEIREKCADVDRKFIKEIIHPKLEFHNLHGHQKDFKRVYAGFDWGQRGNLDQLAGKQRGQSYSCGVIITALNPKTIQIEYATKFKKTDPGYKLEVVEEMFRRYSIHMAVGDIGDASDLTHILQTKYPEKFLASRAAPKVTGHIKYNKDIYPKEIVFERDYYYSELIGMLKDGNVRFPYGSYEEIMWLVEHCCSMEVKVTMNRSQDPVRRYIKGPTPNDGFTALLNAYLAYKFDITQGFTIQQPQFMKYRNAREKRRIPAVLGYIPR